jgi:hypothetical protein
MRLPSRFRALFALCAITASVAGCGDVTSPTAAAESARAGRMLRPDQADQVKPGDFIVIKPEEYKRYGIPTLTAPSGVQTLIAPYNDCMLSANPEYNSCCYDQWGNPTYAYGCDPCYDQWGNYTCNPDPCYDYWGNPTYAPGCPQPNPCLDAWGNPTYAPGCPAPPPTIGINYGSSAPYDGQVSNGGIILKQLRLIAFSQSITNVASFSVDAQFKNVGAASGAGCNNTPYAFDTAHANGTGSPGYVEVSRVAQWLGTVKWQVDGAHSFTPVSGATGGGTFYSTANFCG